MAPARHGTCNMRHDVDYGINQAAWKHNIRYLTDLIIYANCIELIYLHWY